MPSRVVRWSGAALLGRIGRHGTAEAGLEGDSAGLEPSAVSHPLLIAALGKGGGNRDEAFDHAMGLVVAGLSPAGAWSGKASSNGQAAL